MFSPYLNIQRTIQSHGHGTGPRTTERPGPLAHNPLNTTAPDPRHATALNTSPCFQMPPKGLVPPLLRTAALRQQSAQETEMH